MYAAKSTKIFYWGLFLDLLSLNAAYLLAHTLRFHRFLGIYHGSSYRTLLVIVNVLYLVIYLFRLREVPEKKRNQWDTGLHDAGVNFAVFSVLYFAVIVFIQGYEYSRAFHVLLMSLFAVFFFSFRGFIFPKIRDIVVTGSRKTKVVLLGAGELGRMYLKKLNELSDYYDLVAVLDDDPQKRRFFNGEFKGETHLLEDILRTHKIDEVIVTIPTREKSKIESIIQVADRHYAMVKIIPSYLRDLSWRKVHVEDFDGMWLFTMSNSRLMMLKYQLSKRAFDVILSSLILAIAYPILFVLIVPAIKLSSKGPAFFKQKRKGYRGDEFVCWKFRTMRMTDRKSEIKQARPDDPRKTKIGDYLRRTNLDELPQFWNVLKGEMSVVGPRPHMVEHDKLYGELIENYHLRLFGKPGVTGWAQINGFRGATTDSNLMRKRVEHDIWYLENWSIWLDFKIIVRTIGVVLAGTGS